MTAKFIISNSQKEITEEDISKFEVKAREIGKLVKEKNASYGDTANKTARILKILYEDIDNRNDDHLQLIVRILDKVSRVVHSNDSNAILDAYNDIAGYGILGAVMTEEKIKE